MDYHCSISSSFIMKGKRATCEPFLQFSTGIIGSILGLYRPAFVSAKLQPTLYNWEILKAKKLTFQLQACSLLCNLCVGSMDQDTRKRRKIVKEKGVKMNFQLIHKKTGIPKTTEYSNVHTCLQSWLMMTLCSHKCS